MDIGYWYDATEHASTVTLHFDPSEAEHDYGFEWMQDHLSATVDGHVVWSVSGTAGKDLPGNAMQLRLIIRPHDHATGYDGPYVMHYNNFTASFASVGTYGKPCG